MERKLFLRLSAIAFVVGAVLGLILSLGGLIVLWTNKARVTEQLTGTVGLLGSTLTATNELISTARDTLDEAVTDLDLVHEMILDVTDTLDDSTVMVDSTAELIGGSMLEFVDNTKSSLASMENSARAVDSILNKITSIPLLGPWLGNGYNPEVPLQTSVADVSKSMNALPESLTKISRDLDVASANVATIRSEFEILGRQVDSIKGSVTEARGVVDTYAEIIQGMQQRYEAFEKRLPALINTTYMVLTTFLVWMFITQVGMLLHGIALLGEPGL